MKNNQKKLCEVSDEMNQRLTQFVGRKYNNMDECRQWHSVEIAQVLKDNNISEIQLNAWDFIVNAQESNLTIYCKYIGTIKMDVKGDKRCKPENSRGTILSMSVEFREDLLPLTLQEVRTVLFEEERQTQVQNLQKIRDDAMKTVTQVDEQIAKLSAIQF